jgi:ABC-type transport system substrate-binding protein/DNA-binding SARP family transcriptional activator
MLQYASACGSSQRGPLWPTLNRGGGVGTHVQFGILGPLEVRVGGTRVRVGGPRQRALLGLLLCHANQVVSRDHLIDELFRGQAAGSVDRTLRVQVSRLRTALADGDPQPRLIARPPGYLLRVEDGELDLHAFERRVADGRHALEAGDPRRAAALLREAESLWRGRPLGDLEFEPFARFEAQRLEELRLLAVEDRIEAELALGGHTALCPELGQLVAEQPLRERLRGQLMLALYRSGRQADALETYRAGRAVLVEELGLEPSPALRRLECAILQQDAGLGLPVRAVAVPGPDAAEGTGWSWPRGLSRKKRLLALAAAVAVAGALLVAVTTRGPAQLTAGPDTVGVIGTGPGGLSAVVTGVGRPNGVAYGAGAAWVTDSADDLLLKVAPDGQVIDRIPVGRGPAGVVVGAGEVWVANDLDGTVSEVNPGAGRQVAVIPVGTGPSAIAFGYGSVWVANVTSGTLSKINAATGAVAPAISLGSAPSGIAAGAGAVWVSSQATGELLRVDPADNRTVQAIAVGPSPDGLAVGAGSIWVADASGRLTRFDPQAGRLRTIKVGGAPAGVVYADNAVWVANSISGTVSWIDPATGASQLIRVGNEPTNLAAAGNAVWATVLPAPTSHRGGTLTVVAQQLQHHPPPPTDPAVAFDALPWQMLSMTNDGLVGYRRVTGLAGDQLVPDLATALPAPADGGTTYIFRLRAGLRYSTGALVRPEDFRRAIERAFTLDKRLNPGILSYYGGIVGAQQCERSPGPCDLARGIVADDRTNTVTFHLTAPDPEFLYKLAFPWAYAVPPGTPDHQISAAQLPATGPYLTKSLVPGHTWVLARNPRFHQWSQQAQPGGYPDRIVLRLDVGPGQSVTDVEHGRADVLLAPQPDAIGQLATRYASQLHSGPLAATIALTLNTRIPPFNSLAARKAVNYAIDRNKVIALNGGPLTAQPTCHIFPPTMPGYQPYCPYTLQPSPGGAWTAPNLARAQRLVRSSGTRGDKVTVVDGSFGAPLPTPATGRYIASLLGQLGYRATLRTLGPNDYFSVLGDSRNRVQAGFFSWYQDYPAPSDFVDPLLTCDSFVPGNPGNVNTAEFCDPAIDTQARQALILQVRNPTAAADRWAAIDRELVGKAPWVPLYNPRDLTVLSAHVGNYQFHPYWNLLIDQLWVR